MSMRRHRPLAKPIESAHWSRKENVPENRLWRSGLPDVGVACANAFVKHRWGRIGRSQPPSLCVEDRTMLEPGTVLHIQLELITRMAKTHLQNIARPSAADRAFTKSACPTS